MYDIVPLNVWKPFSMTRNVDIVGQLWYSLIQFLTFCHSFFIALLRCFIVGFASFFKTALSSFHLSLQTARSCFISIIAVKDEERPCFFKLLRFKHVEPRLTIITGTLVSGCKGARTLLAWLSMLVAISQLAATPLGFASRVCWESLSIGFGNFIPLITTKREFFFHQV